MPTPPENKKLLEKCIKMGKMRDVPVEILVKNKAPGSTPPPSL